MANTLKNVFEINSFDLLLISFVFCIRNSLEKQTENSGVLLNSEHIELRSTTPFMLIQLKNIETKRLPNQTTLRFVSG